MRVAIAPLPRRLVPLGPARRAGLRYGTNAAPGDTETFPETFPEIFRGTCLFWRRRPVPSAARTEGVGVGVGVGVGNGGDGGDGSGGEVSALMLSLAHLNKEEGLTVMFSLPGKVNEESDRRDADDDDDDDDCDNNGDDDASVAPPSDRAAVLQTLLLPLRLQGGEPLKDFIVSVAGCHCSVEASPRCRSHSAVKAAVLFSRIVFVLYSGQQLSAFFYQREQRGEDGGR